VGLLPDRAVCDSADRRPADASAEAGHEEGGPLTYPGGDLRDQLAHVGAAVVRAGLVVGSGGNLSARAPGSDEIWVTAAGTWLDRLDRDAFVAVRVSDGAVVGDATAAPTTELGLHVATYRARPDVNAVVHLHPQLLVLLDAMGERVRLLTTDHAFYLRRVATARFSPPGSPGVGETAAAAVADGTNCVILRHHGCSVLGERVEMAHRRALNLDEAARLTFQALLLTGGLPGRGIAEAPTDFLADLDRRGAGAI
jgi:L-fuculose-phosphate aldolase